MRLSKKIEDSLELKFSKLAKKMNRKKKISYSLGLGEPNYNTPPDIIKSAFKAMNDGFTRYANPAGDFELRKKISNKLKYENKIESSYKNIIVTSGSKMALYLSLTSLLHPGDHIIYFSPCYTSYLSQILLSERKIEITNINLDKNYQINFSYLKKKIKKNTKAILINYPHNPTGQILTKNILFEFQKILLKNKKIYLISDEIYEKIIFDKSKHISPGSLKNIRKRVITINGFSKAYAMTGWRIGYCHASENLISKMIKIQQHILTNVPVFIQKAAIIALSSKSNHLEKFIVNLNKNYIYAYNAFIKNSFFKFIPSSGSFFIFLKLNQNISSDIFCTNLLNQKRVAVTPGQYFGNKYDKFIRISLSQNHLTFKKAINLIINFVKKK